MSRYLCFEREEIEMASFQKRGHDLTPENCLPLTTEGQKQYNHPDFSEFVRLIIKARTEGHPVVFMMGAHLIKLGLSRFLIDLMEKGFITHLATNGAGIIHDFELALGEGTSENVAHWIQKGQFGLWKETSQLNEVIQIAAERGEGLGEGVGRFIAEQNLPRADLSLAAAGYRLGIPVTSHVSIGSDIIHSHANCCGASLGQASYTDFLIFTQTISELEGGVYLNVGSAVTGPEVYLKSLSMVRNRARQRGESICHFTTAVFDLVSLPKGYREGPPSKDHPMYYYRPWKTILVRTVADGGQSYYFCGDHQRTIPSLWNSLKDSAKSLPKVA
ncbi:MAG: hypothetical protein MPJ24_09525 [Pirellulaceae bacterium]|nr:hypothetical protein [Pirellulaceae bacterium]